ncbi:secretion protein HlyD family protein [Emticicia oligotrophica DSM 17448]|uniref:Secretion protein HlyD family protein n=1 Tax=Emticicia oligotrophica (strain DSM 17448 / CIP 109782 / MTCC 6937 / GPTSA100-15) TaxID=929562 RepID=A0ABM5N2P7_EMTOG|nr:HlyD family secretion protein [Emticicia oligotrophica]AFK03642.1 secretion protein HlyD family protein [Emticicia oligotrophica DSM 17448]
MENAPKKSFKNYIPRIILLLIVIGAAIYAYQKYQYNQHFETTDNAQIETYTVPVVPRVGGYVNTVNMKDFEEVKKGQLLVDIDDREQQLALVEMEAMYQQMLTDVENARASIKNTNLTIGAAEANLKSTVLRQDKARKDAERDAKLLADNAITKRQADDSKANLDIISAQLDGQKQDISASKSRLDILVANLHKAEAALAVQKAKIEQQKLKLTYSKVYATENGKIGRKSVEPGQFIQPGQTLATIVQDSLYWVVANFKETQISRMAVGQEVKITLDAFPEMELKGKIADFSDATGAKYALLPPDNASGNFVKVTQKIPVKIAIEGVEKLRDKLRAGMSVEAEVKIK